MSARSITPRQLEIVPLVAQSVPRKVIAARLGISFKTVEYHLAQLDKWLGGHDPALITRFALREHLIDL